jgi:hypothetical protein
LRASEIGYSRGKQSSDGVWKEKVFRKKRSVWYLEIIIKDSPEDRGGGVSNLVPLRDAIKRYSPTLSCGALRQLLAPIY